MGKISATLYNIALVFIKYCSVALSTLLFLCGFFFTCYAEDMTTQEVLTKLDNPIQGLIGLVCFSAVIYTGCTWVNRKPAKRTKQLFALVLLWYILAGIFLILFSKSVPAADSMSVYSCAAELAAGNTTVIHPTTSYLSYYPHQIGLVAYYEIIIRLWNLIPSSLHAYHFIKCINVLWAGIIIFSQYKSIQLLFKNHIVDTVYLILCLLHIPFLIYTSFVYGEIPSYAMFCIGSWLLLFLLSEKSTHKQTGLLALLSIICFCGSIALRKNNLILLIAVLIITFFEGFRNKKKQLLLLACLYMLSGLLILPTIQKYYEFRAGNSLQAGVPPIAFLAMGMQEGNRAAGWYNGFNFNTYNETGMDTNATTEISLNAIQERLSQFNENPLYAGKFYGEKFLSQWADGTYACLQATLATFGGRHPTLQEIYEGTYSDYFREYCNLLQNEIYLGLLLFALLTFKKNNNMNFTRLPIYLYMICIVGGLLFHMIWEANSRYIFCYGLLFLPYSSVGISYLFHSFTKPFPPKDNIDCISRV